MHKRKRTILAFSIALTALGALFFIISLFLWQSGSVLPGISFPRANIAHVGFAVVGAVYLVSALGMYLITRDNQAMVSDSDERNQKITATAGLYAFGVQTLLLFTALFLLIFMGFMDVVLSVSFIGIALLSIAVFGLAQLYLSRKM